MFKSVHVTINLDYTDFDREFKNVESLDKLVEDIKTEYYDEGRKYSLVESLVIVVSL